LLRVITNKIVGNKMTKIVVLSDGETFDLLDNVQIVDIPTEIDVTDTAAIEDYLRSIR
jgi:hypothetical protein